MEIATQMQQPKSSWYFQNKGRFNDLSVTETNTISTSELYFGIGGAFVRIIKEIDIEHKHDYKESESLLTQVALKFMSVNKITDSQFENENKIKKYQIIELIMKETDTIQKILINRKNGTKLLAYNLSIDNSGTVLLVFEYTPCAELYQFLAIQIIICTETITVLIDV